MCVQVQEYGCGAERYMLHINSLKLDKHIIPLSDIPPTHNIIIKEDSKASAHYWRDADTACVSDIRTYNGRSVILPDAESIAPSKKEY